jgi:hypothetical protein
MASQNSFSSSRIAWVEQTDPRQIQKRKRHAKGGRKAEGYLFRVAFVFLSKDFPVIPQHLEMTGDVRNKGKEEKEKKVK